MYKWNPIIFVFLCLSYFTYYKTLYIRQHCQDNIFKAIFILYFPVIILLPFFLWKIF